MDLVLYLFPVTMLAGELEQIGLCRYFRVAQKVTHIFRTNCCLFVDYQTLLVDVLFIHIFCPSTDCPHPRGKINYFLVNRLDPNQICSGTSKNSAIQLLFPPYKPGFDIDDFAFRKCGKR